MPFHLFERFGVEIEYMVVDRRTLAVRPMVDRLLRQARAITDAVIAEGEDPEWPGEIAIGPIAWSNELALHVVELKTAEPARSLSGLDAPFAAHVHSINSLLESEGCMLLPGGMHPLMDPDREMVLWPHGNSPVYQAFDRIFDCRGHGWANLQACHLNLPFHIGASDTPESEFGVLHAAIRALLPILPALSAASPIMDGKPTGILDNRLEVYRNNSAKIRPATGKVIPEACFTRRDYEQTILGAIYRAYEPHDPAGVLRHEWANSRGAIARFVRDTIEIRVLDAQECPRADLAIAGGIVAVLRAMIAGVFGDLERFRRLEVDPMHAILLECIKNGDLAVVQDPEYLAAFGLEGSKPATAGEVWEHLLDRTTAEQGAATGAIGSKGPSGWRAGLRWILTQGCLSRRILRALGKDTSPDNIRAVYERLGQCLARNEMFLP